METQQVTVRTEATPAGRGGETRPVAGRITCGICNRLLRLETGSPSRHVSCDECAGLLLALAS
jgi:hypothetical protein